MIVCIVSSSSLEEVQRYSSNNDGSLTRKPQVTHIPRVMSVRSVVIVRQNRIPCQICRTLAHHGLAPFNYMMVHIQNFCQCALLPTYLRSGLLEESLAFTLASHNLGLPAQQTNLRKTESPDYGSWLTDE